MNSECLAYTKHCSSEELVEDDAKDESSTLQRDGDFELHHNLILLLKYPDAQIYLRHNSSYIFDVKICMTR